MLEDLSNTKLKKKVSQNLGKLHLVRKFSKNHTFLHKFCMKNNPKYVRSPTKSYPFGPILHEFDTLFTLRTYSARLLKRDPFYVNFWTSLIPPLDMQVAPPRDCSPLISAVDRRTRPEMNSNLPRDVQTAWGLLEWYTSRFLMLSKRKNRRNYFA